MYEKSEPSVWQIASIAVCVFVAIMFVSGAFTGSETVIASATQ